MLHHVDHPHGGRGPQSFGLSFALATALNVALVAAQLVYGIHAHSIALIADAGHNFGDVLGLMLAWGAYVIARWRPTERYTYGFRSATILAALANAAILLLATGAIVLEAVQRLANPAPVAAPAVMVVAGIGIVVNLLSAYLLRGGGRDLNIRGAFLHLVADAAVSLGVLAAGAIILVSAWYWIDPVVSLVISGVIIWSTWGLLKNAFNLSLQAVPGEIEPADVRTYLETLPGVASIHDLHVWAMSTTDTALTCHLVMPAGAPGDTFLSQVCDELSRRFAIAHTTIQIELGERVCRLAPEHVV
jgi:cobalt-zinc-cadmium efflux system protein